MTGQTSLFPVSDGHAAGAQARRGSGEWPRLLFKHAALILSSAGLVTLAALWLYGVQQPVYTSVARVWVKTEQGSPSFLSGVTSYREPLYPDPVNRRIETEMELMLTRTSAASVVQKLQVSADQLPSSPLVTLMSRLPGGETDAGLSNRLVDDFLKATSVEPLRSKTADTTSNILEVRFESADPALAPRALGLLLGNYLDLAATQNRRLGEEASRLLTAELEKSGDELALIDTQIVAMAGRGSVRDAPARGRRDARSSRRARQSTFAGAPVGNEQALAALKTQTVEMQAELDALRELYTDDADNVRALSRRLAAMQRRLSEGLTASAQAVSSLGTLERQRLVAQERQAEVQKKLDQINLYLRLSPADADSRVIVDAPSQPLRSEGKRQRIIALGGPVLGLLLGLMLAGIRESFDQRLQTASDVRNRLGLHVLGALPKLGSAERDRLAGAPR